MPDDQKDNQNQNIKNTQNFGDANLSNSSSYSNSNTEDTGNNNENQNSPLTSEQLANNYKDKKMDSDQNNKTKNISNKSKVDNSSNEEFAKKPPLITTKGLIKIVTLTTLIVVTFILIIVGINFAKAYIESKRPLPPSACNGLCTSDNQCQQGLTCLIDQIGQGVCRNPSCGEDIDCVCDIAPVIEEGKKFAYVKDHSSIWIAPVSGENINSKKLKVFEIFNKDEEITTIDWKDPDNITYSKCTKQTTCEISTFDVKSKSTTPNIVDTDTKYIRKTGWSNDYKYFAYITVNNAKSELVKENLEETRLKIKSGSINNTLDSFYTESDPSNSQSRVIFTPDNEYVVFSTIEKEINVDPKDDKKYTTNSYPLILVYRLNGSKVDEIKNASDPFLLDVDILGYKKDDDLVYKKIGTQDESKITDFGTSYNAELSPNKKAVAYWKNEGGFSDVLLGLYDSVTDIHRNVLRGIVLPVWVNDTDVVGIKADGCLGQNCLLYEYQTTSLALVETTLGGKVQIIDQGKSISDVDVQEFE